MIKVIISLIIIFILNCIDYGQTMYAVSICGLAVEANPIARFFIGSGYGWVPKFVIMPLILALMGYLVRKEPKARWPIYILLVFYVVVVINNFIMLGRII